PRSADPVPAARRGACPSAASRASAAPTAAASGDSTGEGWVAASTGEGPVAASTAAAATADVLPQRYRRDRYDVEFAERDARTFTGTASASAGGDRGRGAGTRPAAVEPRCHIRDEDIRVRSRRLGGALPGGPRSRPARARGRSRRRRRTPVVWRPVAGQP